MKMMSLVCLVLFGTLPAIAAQDIKVVNAQNFNQEIQSGIVLVDFYAPWCGPCKKLSAVLDVVAKDLKEGTRIVKVNVDQSRDLMDSNGVKAVPTLVLFKNGKEAGRLTGSANQQAVENLINSAQ